MSKFNDDISRGCLENGEPIEARWGTGWWSEPCRYPEPEPDWEEIEKQSQSNFSEKKEKNMFGILDVVNGYWTKSDDTIREFSTEAEASDFLIMNGVDNPEAYGLYITLLK